MNFYFLQLIIIVFFFVTTACETSQSEKKSNSIRNISKVIVEKTVPKYAKGFSIIYENDYKLLTVQNPQNTKSEKTIFLLLPQNAEIPINVTYNQIIRTPIKSMVCTSTTHIALNSFLGTENMISGISGGDYVSNPKVLQLIEHKKIMEVGNAEGQLNKEKIIVLSPTIIMVTGGYSQTAEKKTYQEAGITMVDNFDWLETHPLGRAEWTKFLSYFMNKEAQAEQKFNEVEKEYLRLTNLTENLKNKPKTITGLSYNGTWHVSGGRSFAAQLAKDAGANYFYKNDTTKGSVPVDLEIMYKEGLAADFWINPSSVKSKKDLLAKEQRVVDFKSFRSGNIYNNNRKRNAKGWNDYYESSIINPHLVLADLIKIFHPDLVPKHEFYYYQKLE